MPANFYWVGGYGTAAGNPMNWAAPPGANSLPGQYDNLFFGADLGYNPTPLPGGSPPPAPQSAPNCDDLTSASDSFAGVYISELYTNTVELGESLTFGVFELKGGAIAQPTSGRDLTIAGNFTWTGGTLNNTSNLATVTIGVDSVGLGTALFAPMNGGTVSLGSNLTLDDGATMTLQAGTIDITNDGEEITVGENCAVNVDPGLGFTTALTSVLTTHIQVSTKGSFTVKSGTFSAAGRLTNWGTVTLRPDTIAYFPGSLVDDVAYLQRGGATYLYGSQANRGLSTHPNKNMQITGGILNTLFEDGQNGYATLATISTRRLIINDGDIYINYVPDVPHTVDGSLFVTGDVLWLGGTYHPFIEGNVNLGSASFWDIGESLTIAEGAVLAPISVIAGVPSSATSGYNWEILFAFTGINAAPNSPSYDTNAWSIIPVQGAGAEGWRLQSL